MKNNTKTIKTILFASLIAAMILPFSGMDFAEAVNDKVTLKNNAALDNIPEDKLIQRLDNEWKSQYKSKEQFEIAQYSIEQYVNYELPQNGWNQAMQKENIRIHNFDTLIGKQGQSLEIVVLVVAKQQLQGNYHPSEPVEKFHNWISESYDTPTTVEAIDQRLQEIIGDVKYEKLSEKVTKSFNNMVKHGNVPTELLDSDVNYWITVANISICEYDVNCNPNQLRTISYINDISKQTDTIPILGGIIDFFIQEAYAYTGQFHYAYVYGNPLQCDYGTCLIGATGSGTGQVTTSSHSNGGHGIGKYMTIYGSACGTYSGATQSVAVTAYVSGSGNPGTSAVNNPGCAIAQKTVQVSSNPASTWLWTTTNISNSWT